MKLPVEEDLSFSIDISFSKRILSYCWIWLQLNSGVMNFSYRGAKQISINKAQSFRPSWYFKQKKQQYLPFKTFQMEPKV